MTRSDYDAPHLPLATSERAELEELRRVQPGLWLRRVDQDHLVLAGRLSLFGADGVEVDAYLVEVRAPRAASPRALPEVFECGDRIPRIADRHVFTDTGACCIEFPVEYLLRRRQSLAQYVNGHVRSYFVAQSHFEQLEKWPHGEMSHGRQGVREFCVAQFGVSDLELIERALQLFDRWREAKHGPCPCGSRRKFLKCHGLTLQPLRVWPAAARAELADRIRTQR